MNNLPPKIRLNKFLAERLGVSRREADELISAGKVTIDGHTAELGDRIAVAWAGDGESGMGGWPSLGDPRANARGGKCEDRTRPEIYCNGELVPFETEYLYLAFHKPVGYVCSRRAQGAAPTLYELLPKKYRHLKTVGRLDKDSSGLILLTNDGDFAYKMTHPKFRKTKVYEVELNKPLEPLHQQIITDYGVLLDDGVSQFKVIRDEEFEKGFSQQSADPSSHFDNGHGRVSGTEIPGRARLTRCENDDCGSTAVGDEQTESKLSVSRRRPAVFQRTLRETLSNSYIVILTEGRNRQIRRTFAALGYKVTKLHRVQFGKYELGSLKPAEYVIIKP